MDKQNSFWVEYQVEADDRSDAEFKAGLIAVEQSVEMPPEVVPASAQKNIGKVLDITQLESEQWSVKINYHVDLFDGDITQFLNILFGNISLQPWCRLLNTDTAILNTSFQGPAFGTTGIRKLLNVDERALSCAVIKPIGASSDELSGMAHQFASGGIDIIKDDHGLTDQKSAPFKERVIKCVQAVRSGEQHTGKKTLYFPNITVSPFKVKERFEQAAELGADGVLIAPQLVGLETLHELTKSGTLPIMAHPTFSGSYLINKSGVDPAFYFGKLTRSLGADAIIYPNADGRFSFTTDLCKKINRSCREKRGGHLPALPAPGGGVRLETIPGLVRSYGSDTLFLIGGSLFKQGDIKNAAMNFQQALENHEQ